MPRKIRFVDWILLVVVFITLYTILNYDSDGVNESTELDAVRPDFRKEDIREMCQFLEQEVTGEEGDQWVKGNDYEKSLRLRGISLVFRHGERSPVSKVEDEIGCLPFRDVDRKAFAAYKELAESDEVKAFLKLDSGLRQFPRVPLEAKCISGMLTAEGALQHVRLGKYFRKRYEKTAFFADENQRIVTDIVSSKYNRTVQSVLAFSSEFLFKQRGFVAPVEIKASNFSYQCVDEFCACKVHKSIRKTYEDEHLQDFNEQKSDDVADEEQRLLSFPQFAASFDPFQMIDVGLGSFICRRRALPCHGENCVTFDSFNKMINVTTARGTRMFDDRIGVARRLQILESYPILTYLKDSIARIRKFPHSNYIQIFSAHDVVVGPILRVLGVPFVDPPHYTSRIVFEVYEHSEEGLYVRLVYNGRNRTYDVRFCQGDNLKYGMCKASAFEEFAKKGLFELAGVSEFKELCYV